MESMNVKFNDSKVSDLVPEDEEPLDPHISIMPLVSNVQDINKTQRLPSSRDVQVASEINASTSADAQATEVTFDNQVTSKDPNNSSLAKLFKKGPPT
uniref:Uncharacterized protein n=1 Tax=Cannabis sativa TaxID=3483 RepID=A0A803R4P5_CANSA